MKEAKAPTDSPTLKRLQEEHPEWCFTCGKYWLEPNGIHTCHDHPLVAALIAKAEEDEAEIAALKQTAFNIGADAGGYLDKIAALKASIASLEAKNAELRKPETNPEWVILAEDHKRLESQLRESQLAVSRLKDELNKPCPGCGL